MREDDAVRFRRMFEEYGAYVSRRLRLLAVPESDLDDALQEVFIVVLQRLHDFEERGRTRGWLHSICTRVVWARRRKQKRRAEELVDRVEAAHAPTQHVRLVETEALALGRQLLQSLPAEQRDVFWLYEVEDLTMPEIAQIVGCPLQTAYSRLHKARERILAAVQQASAKTG